MTEKFKILARFIKDLSSETPNIETFIFVKDQIAKYQLGIDINSKPLKNKMVEINTTFKSASLIQFIFPNCDTTHVTHTCS